MCSAGQESAYATVEDRASESEDAHGFAQFKNEWLADLIERHADRILDDWLHAVRSGAGPHFAIWSDEGLRSMLNESLQRTISAFRSGDLQGMSAYIRVLIATRVSEGFEPQEIQRSIVGLKDSMAGVIDESRADTATKYGALRGLAQLYDQSALLISEVFQELQSAQQARLLTLYELSTSLSQTLVLSAVMKISARKVVSAVAATAGAIVLVDADCVPTYIGASYKMGPRLRHAATDIVGAIGCAPCEAGMLDPRAAARVVSDVRLLDSLGTWHDLLASEDCASIACAPLVSSDRVLGVLVVFLPETREIAGSELDFLLALAGITATAMQNAMLFAEAKGKRELELLLEAAKLFTSTLDPDQVMYQIAKMCADSFGADYCGVLIPDERREFLHTGAFYARKTTDQEAFRQKVKAYEGEGIPVNAVGPGQAFTSGEPLLVSDMSRYPNAPEVVASMVGSALFAPMESRGTVLGLFVLVCERIGAFDESDMRLAMGVADQAAIAIENARLYERQMNIADSLQRSLLPDTLPQVDGWQMAARYQAAFLEAEVGGDFYDVFPTEDGRFVVLIGDVSGKGLSAAKYTAMAKYMMRAYAGENPDPGWLLGRLNASLSKYLPVGLFITVFYALLDPVKHELVYASAGHDQPVLYSKRQDGLSLLDVTGPGLGVIEGAKFAVRSLMLGPGDTLMLYTDGATDVKADGKRLGLEGLEAVFRSAVCLPAEQAADRIFRGVLDYGEGRLADDVVILILKRKDG